MCYGLGMTTETTTQPAKRGRKPLGDAAMSAAERKRRSRERQQATGVKEFQLQVQGMHLAYVEQLAEHNEVSASAALRMLLEPALDRYVGVMRRCERMKENGATDEQVAAFMHTHLMPELPTMPEINGQ
jgi:hypothetical protein